MPLAIYTVVDCKLAYWSHLILLCNVLLPSLRQVVGSISVYLVQWRIHSGDHYPQTYLTVVFPTRFATFVASLSFCLSAETTETCEVAILQKQDIIEGDWPPTAQMDPPPPTRQCISEKHQLSMFTCHSRCWRANYCWIFTRATLC